MAGGSASPKRLARSDSPPALRRTERSAILVQILRQLKATPETWPRERYRAEHSPVRSILRCVNGSSSSQEEMWIACSFVDDERDTSLENVEMTPYEVVRDQCPRKLLEYWKQFVRFESINKRKR